MTDMDTLQKNKGGVCEMMVMGVEFDDTWGNIKGSYRCFVADMIEDDLANSFEKEDRVKRLKELKEILSEIKAV